MLQRICYNADDITIYTLLIFSFWELNWKIEPDNLISFLKINNKIDKLDEEYKLVFTGTYINL